MTFRHDVGVEESSQDEFVIHSHTFGFKNKGNSKSQSRDQGKKPAICQGPEDVTGVGTIVRKLPRLKMMI